MKYPIFLSVAAFCALVSAQVTQLPTCAQSCVGTNLKIPGCGSSDIACICRNKDYVGSLSCCVKLACSEADLRNTITFATQLCKSAGIELDTNAGPSTCPSSTASASGATGNMTMTSGSASGTAAIAASATSRTSNPGMTRPLPTGGALLGGAAAALFAFL